MLKARKAFVGTGIERTCAIDSELSLGLGVEERLILLIRGVS